MEEGLDIQAQTVALAEMVGVRRDRIAEIVLRPNQLVVTRYLENENGRLYSVMEKEEADRLGLEVGDTAMEKLTFKVSKS